MLSISSRKLFLVTFYTFYEIVVFVLLPQASISGSTMTHMHFLWYLMGTLILINCGCRVYIYCGPHILYEKCHPTNNYFPQHLIHTVSIIFIFTSENI